MVSNVLLKRERFLPAPSLNVIAAAWIQFQVHDWVKHPLGNGHIEVSKPDGGIMRIRDNELSSPIPASRCCFAMR